MSVESVEEAIYTKQKNVSFKKEAIDENVAHTSFRIHDSLTARIGFKAQRFKIFNSRPFFIVEMQFVAKGGICA